DRRTREGTRTARAGRRWRRSAQTPVSGGWIRFAAAGAEGQSKFDLYLREPAIGARPPDSARDLVGVSQPDAARGVSVRFAFYRMRRGRSRRKRASLEDRGAVPPWVVRTRFRAGRDPRAAD